jgi:hypothetical protein
MNGITWEEYVDDTVALNVHTDAGVKSATIALAALPFEAAMLARETGGSWVHSQYVPLLVELRLARALGATYYDRIEDTEYTLMLLDDDIRNLIPYAGA